MSLFSWGDTPIPAHRWVLKDNEFFDRMMQSEMVEGRTCEIRLKEISPYNAEILLRYLYGEPIPQDLSFDKLIDLLKETHRYNDKKFTDQLWVMIDAKRGTSVETRIDALELEVDYRDGHHHLTPRDFHLDVIAELSYHAVVSMVSHLKKSGYNGEKKFH